MNKQYLIIGAGSVAGTKTIEAIRNKDANAVITGTTSKSVNLLQCDHTIQNVDLSKPINITDIQKQLTDSPDIMVYCPAFGKVGTPISMALPEDVTQCLQFSVEPMWLLMEKLNPKLTIGFSSYYWIDSLRLAYGAMGFAKYALEKMAENNPSRIHIVRAGVFPSQSIRGISLMIQRGIIRDSFPEAAALKKEWKDSGLPFAEYFMIYATNSEKVNLANMLEKPYRGTQADDLIEAIELAIENDENAITNVVGGQIWQEKQLPKTPEFISGNKKCFELINLYTESKLPALSV